MFSNESNESLNVTEDKTAETTLASPTPALESPSSVKLNFRYVGTVPNDLKFWLFVHFKKVSWKKTVFNQSNGRKFENSFCAQKIQK